MILSISHHDRYSRGQLILRTLFGLIYIAIPHLVLLIVVGIWSAILAFVTFWVVLFTGRFPESIFRFQVKFTSWQLRLQASLSNLVDGYPAFLPGGTSSHVTLEVSRPERVNRGLVILRLLFGSIYVYIPHGVCLLVRQIVSEVLIILAWFAVLVTGKYPESWHAFNVGSIRWAARVGLYMGFFTDTYPAFSGRPD